MRGNSFLFSLYIFIIFLVLAESQAYNNDNDYTTEDYESDDSSEPSEDLVNFSPLQSFINDVLRDNTTRTNTTIDDILYLKAMSGRDIEAIIRVFLPLFDLQSLNLSPICASTLLSFFNSVRRQEEWPFRFLDSSGRFPFSGLLSGRISDFGEFRDCLNIKVDQGELSLRGQYCLASFSLRMPQMAPNMSFHSPIIASKGTPLEDSLWELIAKNANLFYIARGIRIGVCVPNTCSPEDLHLLLKGFSSVGVQINSCQTEDTIQPPLSNGQKISIAIISFLSIFAIISSIRPQKNLLFRCFALTESTKRLFLSDTRTKRLSAVHGIRVLCILWIFVGHIYLMQFFEVFHVLRATIRDMPWLSWIRYQPLILGSFLQVDSFLLLGGLTASFVTLETLKKESFDYFFFLIFRWLRYSPALIGLLLFYQLLPQLSTGPIYPTAIRVISDPCQTYWWRNILYINNWFDATGNCATHTWYLAADFQYYAISPLVVLLMSRRPFLGVLLCIFFIVLGCVLPTLPSLLNKDVLPALYSLNTILSEERIQRQFRILYWSTLQHSSPYFMGLLLGYLVHSQQTLPFSPCWDLLIWGLTAFSGIGTIFWTTTWMDSTSPEEFPGFWHRLIFTAIHKVTWSLLPFWIILSTAFGRPGLVGRFFSWKGWVPMSRLTYCLYLVQLIPIVVRSYSVEYTFAFNDFYNWSMASFCLILATLLAFVLFALFESPFSEGIRYLVKTRKG